MLTRIGVLTQGSDVTVPLRSSRLWQRTEVDGVGSVTFLMPPGALVSGHKFLYLEHPDGLGLRWTQRAFTNDASGRHGRVISWTSFDADGFGSEGMDYYSAAIAASDSALVDTVDTATAWERINNNILVREVSCGGDVVAEDHNEYFDRNGRMFSLGRWGDVSSTINADGRLVRLRADKRGYIERAVDARVDLRYSDGGSESCWIPEGSNLVSRRIGFMFNPGEAVLVAGDLSVNSVMRGLLIRELDQRRYVHIAGRRLLRATFVKRYSSYCPSCMKHLTLSGSEECCDDCTVRGEPVVGLRGTRSAHVFSNSDTVGVQVTGDLEPWLLPAMSSEVVMQRQRANAARLGHVSEASVAELEEVSV